MIYAIALGSNFQQADAMAQAQVALAMLGHCHYSPMYQLPDRLGIGPLYWNQALLLHTDDWTPEQLATQLGQIEQDCGRVRPSKQVRMDVDLIAWGNSVATLLVDPRRMPLPLDVTLPMQALWPACPMSASCMV
jgi:2-amino-4-hydroxy-6-hydroxymethyldihydropteridine diphosphokinase